LIWLVRDFDLLAVLLHAVIFSSEALLLGGIFFLLVPARTTALHAPAQQACSRLMLVSAGTLALAEAATIALTSVTMLAGSTMAIHDLLSASYLRAEAVTILCALLLAFVVRSNPRRTPFIQPVTILLGLGVLTSIVYLSHAFSQMDHRTLLAILTALHHLGTAAWIGAMPYLLLTLSRTDIRQDEDASRLVRRYSAMALVSVGILVAAGFGMAWFYVGAGMKMLSGLYGSSYGLMLLAKIYLLLLMLILGAGNWTLLRTGGTLSTPLLLRLRRFTEAEIGLGFTILLVAASLTSQSPASDLQPGDLVTAHAYRVRLAPRWPRLTSPSFSALKPPTSLRQGLEEHQFGFGGQNDAMDDAWSEYNHHWAGLMVLLAGSLALLAATGKRSLRWARYWPISFIGLASFIVLRADPEAWPLGPRPFWASFSYPDVLEHRLEALLIVAFAAFEAAVQSGRLRIGWARYVFPLICALGAALLLTHSHGFADMASETLSEASHTAIAVLGATAAWARWLELRLDPTPENSRPKRIAGAVWPVALLLVGLVLLNYREA
jgi:putative copper resistance protein D